MSFARRDRIRLVGCPPDLRVKLRSTIQNYWGHIQAEKVNDGALEFKLEGNPWSSWSSEEDYVLSRQLLAGLLACSITYGWKLIQASDITKVDGEKDVMFFENATPEPDVSVMVMSLHSSDTIRLINADQYHKQLLKDAVKSQWKLGIERDGEYHGSYEIKMTGKPWVQSESGGHKNSVLRTCLMCQIIANFKVVGYKLYGCVNISSSTDGADLDTWVFKKTKK